jgi:hypothetical protein
MKKLLLFVIFITLLGVSKTQAQFDDNEKQPTVEVKKDSVVVQKIVVPEKSQAQIALEMQLDSLKNVNSELQNQKEQLSNETASQNVWIDSLRNNLEIEMAKNQGVSKKFDALLTRYEAKHAADSTANNKTVENVVPVIANNEPVIAKKDPVVKQNAPTAKNPATVKYVSYPVKGSVIINDGEKTYTVRASDKELKKAQITFYEKLGYKIQEVNK